MILAISNKYDLELCQMDVKTAFLNANLNVPVFMEIPEGIECSSDIKRQKVCKLEKALYGLKLSPKCCNQRFTETVKGFGLKPDFYEPCLFTWHDRNKFLILILYVDDILLASNNRIKLKKIKTNLARNFDMTNIGEPKSFLGLEIQRDRKLRTLKINQENYIVKMISKFGYQDVHPQRTPMITNQVANRQRREREEKENISELIATENNDNRPYRKVIGTLLYLANACRPDIAYTVNVLSRHQT